MFIFCTTCHHTPRDFCDWKIHQARIMINEKFFLQKKKKKIEELLSMCNVCAKTLEVWWKYYFTHKPIILITPLDIFWLENIVILNYNWCKLLIFSPKSKRASPCVCSKARFKTMILSLIVFCNISYLIKDNNNTLKIKEKWTCMKSPILFIYKQVNNILIGLLTNIVQLSEQLNRPH